MSIFSLFALIINRKSENSTLVTKKEKNLINDRHNFNLTKLLHLTQIDLFKPVKKWLDNIEIKDSSTAHRICQLIPSQCPFAREIKLLNHKVATIPPLCKLNPLYQNLIGLKFRSLTYLADTCGEDITSYC